MLPRIRAIATEQAYARHLGFELISAEPDKVVMKLPWAPFLGDDRVNGGAIASLVDVAGTCACWADPTLAESARGATVGFSISYMKLVVEADITATAHVRRRGGSICFADISVQDDGGNEVAMAQLTYKLSR